MMAALLVVFLALPAGIGIFVGLLGPRKKCAVRWLSLVGAVGELAIACVLTGGFLGARAAETHSWQSGTFNPELVPGASLSQPRRTSWDLLPIGNLGSIQFYLGLDGISVWLILLTAVLLLSAVLISWKSVQERVNEYYAWLLILGSAMIGVFLAFDVILFYVFFELTLVPLFFLIGIWGGPERRYAARKFFIFTLAGSLLTFLGVMAVVIACYQKARPGVLTFAIPDLVRIVNEQLSADPEFWKPFQFWVFLALALGFSVKVPLVPVHTWLPLAHTEAPTAGSVLLAGVLLKLGTYGFLRLCLPLAPDACILLGAPIIGSLAVVGIIYGSFCALAQEDIKKLVAYSSVAHLGFCMLGMFSFNMAGLSGSFLQMINHGLSTGGLFLVVGMIYERYHTRMRSDFSGLGSKLSKISVCMVFIVLSSIGLPGLNGFVGEALVLFGAFEAQTGLAVLATAGIILGAWYLLSMLRDVFFGPLKEPHVEEGTTIRDLTFREFAAIAPIMVACVALGIYPQPVLDSARPDLEVVARLLQTRGLAIRAELQEQPDPFAPPPPVPPGNMKVK